MKGYIAQRSSTPPAHLTAVRYTGALLGVVLAVLLRLWLQPVVDATIVGEARMPTASRPAPPPAEGAGNTTSNASSARPT